MADTVWQRAAPNENPYPEIRTAPVGLPGAEHKNQLCRELLQQELRHTAALLSLLEKSLAESP